MSKIRAILLSAAFASLSVRLLGAGQQPGPDLILLNGKVFTSDRSHPYLEALAIRGDRITTAGTSERIAAMAGPMLASVYPGKPREAIRREQAVTAYTLTAAYAEFAEKEKGSLEPGKLADLAVLSQDIFTVPPMELPKTESVLTMVGGKIVYDPKVVEVPQ